MSLASRLVLLALAAFAGRAPAQDLFWVNPDQGQDSAARDGSESQPFRTLGYAIGRQLSGRSLTVLLQPGRYLTESWPMDVGPDDLAVEAEAPGSVYLHGYGTSAANFRLRPTSGDFRLRGLTIKGAQDVIKLQGAGPAGSTLHVSLDRMFCEGGNLIHAVAEGDLDLQLDLVRTWYHGASATLLLRAWDTAHIEARVSRSRLFRSGFGVDAKAFGNQSGIDIRLENSLLLEAMVNGVRLESQGSPVHAEIVHCTLAGNGLLSMPSRPAVKLVQPSSGAPVPTAAIRRSIVWGNGRDVYWFAGTGPNFTFESNIVEDAALAGLGGNLNADPEWMPGSYLCGPASPARDAAPPGVAVDYLGRPRSSVATDLGAFELNDLTLGFTLYAFAGLTQDVSVSGPPLARFAVVAGFARAPGPGLRVAPVAPGAPLFGGHLDATGFASHRVGFPADRGLEGRRIFYQAVALDPAGAVLRSEVVPILVSVQL